MWEVNWAQTRNTAMIVDTKLNLKFKIKNLNTINFQNKISQNLLIESNKVTPNEFNLDYEPLLTAKIQA